MAERGVLFQDREGIQATVVDRPGRQPGSTPSSANTFCDFENVPNPDGRLGSPASAA